MHQQLVFVARQSPDWAGLAGDFQRARHIDPARFRPSAPGFPQNIGKLVDLWNTHMSIDFFSCRARLKEISDDTIAQLPGARRVSHDAVSDIASELEDSVVWFHDDDDWFSPHMATIMSEISFHEYDVCVFPLVRLSTETFTFVRRGEPTRVIVGRKKDFDFRYQSNNYGLNGRICDPETLLAMKDHVLASSYANKRALRDIYIDQIIGVTAKTPCSAGRLASIFAVPAKAKEQVRRFVDASTALAIPAEHVWIADSVASVARLFAAVS